MTSNLLPGKRYLWRELIPRAVLMTVTFKYFMPLVPFGLFRFSGGVLAAAAFGIAFTVFFCILGTHIMSAPTVQKFLEANGKAWWFIPFNLAIVIGLPALALALAALAPCFEINGLLAVLVGAVILNIVCALTHDYKQ